MSAFLVTVQTLTARHTYTAIATSSFDAHAAAVDRFGPCSVRVVVKP